MNGYGGFLIFEKPIFDELDNYKKKWSLSVCRYFPHSNLIEILFSVRDISKSRHFRFLQIFLLVSKKRNESENEELLRDIFFFLKNQFVK